MEDLTTEQYSVLISDSWINGQHKQAIAQFKRARADSVNVPSLLADISNELGHEKTLKLAGVIIETMTEEGI